jgi:hypothetical protein
MAREPVPTEHERFYPGTAARSPSTDEPAGCRVRNTSPVRCVRKSDRTSSGFSPDRAQNRKPSASPPTATVATFRGDEAGDDRVGEEVGDGAETQQAHGQQQQPREQRQRDGGAEIFGGARRRDRGSSPSLPLVWATRPTCPGPARQSPFSGTLR